MNLLNHTSSRSSRFLLLSGWFLVSACSASEGPVEEEEPEQPGEEPNPDERPRDESLWGKEQGEGPWRKVELQDAVCADGSPYKFFVKRNETSSDLTITLEPGGACWSYDSCTGAGGIQRVANIDGLRDDHMTALPPPLGSVEGAVPWGLMFPHLGESDAETSTADFNHVFLPYCTGDAFLGDATRRYENEDGESVEIEHRGAHNLSLVQEWLAANFSNVERLLITGASAGGLGATMHYGNLREALGPQSAALINDSGPLFPPGSHQDAAKASFADRWGAGDLLATLDEHFETEASEVTVLEDAGNLTALLAQAYPEDRLAVTFFLRDLNYSLFSYLGFHGALSVDEVYAMWDEDTSRLAEELERFENWDYYFPVFRPDGCSHTVSLLPADELTGLTFVSDALAGKADGYLRTELEDLTFENLLDNAFDQQAKLLRARGTASDHEFTDTALAACLEWPE